MDKSNTPEPEVLAVAEVSKKLRIGRRQTYEGIRRGEIQGCYPIGKQIRCSKVAIETWLHGREPAGNVEDHVCGLTEGQRDRLANALHEAIDRALDDFAAETGLKGTSPPFATP